MKYTILGAGAMGSLFGGLLAAKGHDVELLDVNDTHLASIRTDGLRLETDTGEKRVHPLVFRPESALRQPDWLIVFTKTLHTQGAMRSVQHLLGPHTHVLSLQNGLGNLDKIAAFVPLERIAIGVTTVPADMKGPGHVQSHGQGHSKLMGADGNEHPALTQLVADLDAAGLSCALDNDVLAAIWRKVAFNAALNSMSAVTGCTVGQLGRLPAGRALAHRLSDEVIQVARASGIDVDAAGVHADLDFALDKHIHHKPSMFQDILAGRPTEVDAINGAVQEQGARVAVPTPCISALHTLVKLIETRDTHQPA